MNDCSLSVFAFNLSVHLFYICILSKILIRPWPRLWLIKQNGQQIERQNKHNSGMIGCLIVYDWCYSLLLALLLEINGRAFCTTLTYGQCEFYRNAPLLPTHFSLSLSSTHQTLLCTVSIEISRTPRLNGGRKTIQSMRLDLLHALIVLTNKSAVCWRKDF